MSRGLFLADATPASVLCVLTQRVLFSRCAGLFVETMSNRSWKRPSRLVPLALVLLVILAFTAYRIAARSGVKREIEAIRARGLPTTLLELDKWYRVVPASENAAIAFMDAYALYVAPVSTNNPSENNKVKMVLGQPLPPQLAEQVQMLLSKNRETIEELHKAAELKQSRYPIDMTRGFATLLPHLVNLKRMGQLLGWEAVQQSADGNKAATLKAIQSAFAVAASLDEEPILISSMVRMVILQETLRVMERVVSEQTLTIAELEELSDLLARAEERGKHALRRCVAGERGFGLPGFEMDYKMFEAISSMGSVGPDSLPREVKLALYELRRAVGISDKDKAFFIDSIGAYEKTLELEYPEMLREARRIHDGIMTELQGNQIRYMVSGLVLPGMDAAVQKAAINAGFLRCARTAVAVERFRMKTGKMPAMDELVPEYLPEVPRDPVSGEVLVIEKMSKGFRVVAEEASELRAKGGKKNGENEVAFSVLK
jgi:hypothetical protein